jgi:hypothetical protein
MGAHMSKTAGQIETIRFMVWEAYQRSVILASSNSIRTILRSGDAYLDLLRRASPLLGPTAERLFQTTKTGSPAEIATEVDESAGFARTTVVLRRFLRF